MNIPKHRQGSENILARLMDWGFTPGAQQRIGAFAIVWGLFETNLETTLWELRAEQVVGVRPSTDKTTIGQWIDAFGEGSSLFSQEAKDLLRTTATAAKDLMEYRHALAHGWLIPSQTLTPSFIRNPTWHGEKRSRPNSDAHVDENLLDMAIETTWILCRVVLTARAACSDASRVEALRALKSDVDRAKSTANELRHLTALMNDERY